MADAGQADVEVALGQRRRDDARRLVAVAVDGVVGLKQLEHQVVSLDHFQDDFGGRQVESERLQRISWRLISV